MWGAGSSPRSSADACSQSHPPPLTAPGPAPPLSRRCEAPGSGGHLLTPSGARGLLACGLVFAWLAFREASRSTAALIHGTEPCPPTPMPAADATPAGDATPLARQLECPCGHGRATFPP